MKSQTFPTTILPFFDEVQAFTEKLHKHVLFNVLRLFAMALELPSETLVDRHQFNVHDESWMRYMAYYDEYTAEEEAKTNNVWREQSGIALLLLVLLMLISYAYPQSAATKTLAASLSFCTLTPCC